MPNPHRITYRLTTRDYRRFLLWDGATRWPDPAPIYPED